MARLARILVNAEFNVILDATFLRKSDRALFFELARETNVPITILSFQAAEATLRERIAQRLKHQKDISEADEAVLEYQQKTLEPLTEAELNVAHEIHEDVIQQLLMK